MGRHLKTTYAEVSNVSCDETWLANSLEMRFQVLMAESMKFRVFRDVAPCSHVEVGRPDDGGSTHL
jgi:hypothetical protein